MATLIENVNWAEKIVTEQLLIIHFSLRRIGCMFAILNIVLVNNIIARGKQYLTLNW